MKSFFPYRIYCMISIVGHNVLMRNIADHWSYAYHLSFTELSNKGLSIFGMSYCTICALVWYAGPHPMKWAISAKRGRSSMSPNTSRLVPASVPGDVGFHNLGVHWPEYGRECCRLCEICSLNKIQSRPHFRDQHVSL